MINDHIIYSPEFILTLGFRNKKKAITYHFFIECHIKKLINKLGFKLLSYQTTFI